ncbi:competence protein ComK [Neobacillus jeddahensis]|uniref:competence protein ComK n=1 Tax=Neobacillus jeddahensis TaxID=1461580 RepID=UPI00058F2B1B|nr:competence protein ComK [Neobacillus jeddahensis]
MIKHFYLLDPNIVLVTGEYDPYGKLCTRVILGKETFLVDRTPAQLLDDTLLYIGFNLNGAIKGARSILGNRKMCPVIVNPFHGVCFFPNKSAKRGDCIWFNPDHIVKTKPRGTKTEVELSNELTLIIDSKLHSFHNKMQIAFQLKQLSQERCQHPNHYASNLQPKKRKPLTRGDAGTYNFASVMGD